MRPTVIVSCAVSLDSYLDDDTPCRLILSGAEDLAAVDELRANVDAIMVGAETIRRDNPSLLIKSKEHQLARLERGLAAGPAKITWTTSGEIPAEARYFCKDGARKIVFCCQNTAAKLAALFGDEVEVVGLAERTFKPAEILERLASLDITKVLLEGGAKTIAEFMKAGCVDQLRVSVAPFFLGKKGGPRLTFDPLNSQGERMVLERVEQIGDMAVLWYLA